MRIRAKIINYAPQRIGFAKKLIWVFHKMVQKPNEIFGQPNILKVLPLHDCMIFLACLQIMVLALKQI